MDRGLNISFGDFWLPPNHALEASPDGQAVWLSFKDGTNQDRIDVSSLELAGASDCPSNPIFSTWPPPPPPPPPPCSAGRHPWRACPGLDWYPRLPIANAPVAPAAVVAAFQGPSPTASAPTATARFASRSPV